MQIYIQRLPRMVILAGLAAWMSIAALNNITDTATNLFHLDVMTSMELLKQDALLGNGLEWRALGQGSGAIFLSGVVLWQMLTAAALWWAAQDAARGVIGRCDAARLSLSGNLALSMFLAMWLSFLCGGLWFGYWMKQGAIQGVHLSLVILSLAALHIINLPAGEPLRLFRKSVTVPAA